MYIGVQCPVWNDETTCFPGFTLFRPAPCSGVHMGIL